MRRYVDVANIVMAVLAGCCLVMLKLSPELTQVRIEGIARGYSAYLAFVIGAVVVVANVMEALRELRGGGLRRNIEVTSEDGVNTISIIALERQLLDELRKVKDVVEPALHLEARGDGLPILCRINFKLSQSEDVMARADAIKKLVRDAFLKIIPSHISIEIHANVVDIVNAPVISPAPAAPMPGKKNEFSGPDYTAYENMDSEADEVRS